MKKSKKDCYTPAAVKNGKVSTAHKTYANPGPAKAGAVRLAKVAGGKPVVVRSNGKDAAPVRRNKDMRGRVSKSADTTKAWQAQSRFESSGWTDKSAAKTLTDMLGWDVLDHFEDGDPGFWDGELQDRIEKKFGLPASMNPARKNPKNPLRQVVLGHPVTWSPKKGGYVIDAYQMVFPTVKGLRTYLKGHVAKELKELRHR